MADNRDPRKKSRTRRQLRTSSSGRAARSKASAKDTPRPTSSSDRAKQQGKGSSKVTTGKGGKNAPPRGAQGPRTPPVQGPSRRVSGIIGTRKGSTSTPKNPPPTSRPRNTIKPTKSTAKGGKGGSSGLKTTLAAGMVTALATGALRNPVSKAKTKESKENRKKIEKRSVGKYNTKDKDGTVRNRAKVGPAKVGPGKVGTIAQAFDKAFATAKKAGKKTFTFKGKKYTTQSK
jgi:hypothetical protein